MISYIKTELMKEKRSASLRLGIIVPIIFVLFNIAMVSLMGESPEGKSYILATSFNWYVNYLNDGNTISFGQDTATMFHQSEPYFTGDKIKVFEPKEFLLSRHNALYCITATKKIINNFSWGATLYNVGNLENIKVEMPIQNKKLDINFMEDFIKIIEKLVITDIVLWADKKIEATKEVVSRN